MRIEGTEKNMVTIYHNPRCGTSCNTLALLQERGVQPEVVEYLKTPLDRAALRALIASMGVPVIDVVRAKEPVFAELKLGAPGVSDEQLIDAMVAHPILMNRPIVVTPRGARLCRPAEAVLELLAPGA